MEKALSAAVLVAFLAAAALVPAATCQGCPPLQPGEQTRKNSSNMTRFVCNIEDRMGNKDYEMNFACNNKMSFDLSDGGSTTLQCYNGVLGRAAPPPPAIGWAARSSNPPSPRAWSCREGAGGMCRLVFENKVVTLVTAKGRRVMGDVAIKECSKNWFGWLPFGLGCTYPKHDHPYIGTIVE
ncbi:hypothetical protein ZWY2020_020587 [Hordeum vulgare]|nr:hypothetical protein ZWY2020_020587 [Hordeum vulgare]